MGFTIHRETCSSQVKFQVKFYCDIRSVAVACIANLSSRLKKKGQDRLLCKLHHESIPKMVARLCALVQKYHPFFKRNQSDSLTETATSPS